MDTETEDGASGLLHDIRERWYDLEDRFTDLQDKLAAMASGTVETGKRTGEKIGELYEDVSEKFDREPMPFFLAAFAIGGLLGLIFSARRSGKR